MSIHPCCWRGLVGRGCRHYPRPIAPTPFPNVEYQWSSYSVPVTYEGIERAPRTPPEGPSLLALIQSRMDQAAGALDAYLTTSLWPVIPWYRILGDRLKGAALVLIGRRRAVTDAVAFHVCPTERDDDE